ncbi:hypothetical protein ES705_42095 [subsurface metagenome]
MCDFSLMEQIGGQQAIQLMHDVSKLDDGSFTIAFFPYSRAKNTASSQLRVFKGCKTRAQLPREKWNIDSENFLLFNNADGEPKTCYRFLIRFVGFPNDNFELHKVNWL